MYRSDYCEVNYEEKYNVVFVKWKKFCCNQDYREPLEYALDIIKQHENCNYVAERLYPVEPGIFVKEFTLFFGDRLTWFITETAEDGSEISTPDCSLTSEEEEELLTGSKYAAVYEMARSVEEHNRPLLEKQMEAYQQRQFLVETLFALK